MGERPDTVSADDSSLRSDEGERHCSREFMNNPG